MRYTKILTLMLSVGFSLSMTSCGWMKMQHQKEMMEWNRERPYWQVKHAKILESEYAEYFEKKVTATLKPIFGEKNIKVNVFIQLDFDQSKEKETVYPSDGKQIKEESDSKDQRKNGDRVESKKNHSVRYKLTEHSHKTDIHPGRIQQLNISVLINKRVLTTETDVQGLLDQVSMLVKGATPYREDRGDTVDIEVIDFQQ